MAYLKGTTYIDGDLNVNGSLYVQKLADASGTSIPYLDNEDAAIQDRLVKFSDNTGGLIYSAIEEVIGEDSLTYNVISTAVSLNFDFKGKNLTLSNLESLYIDTLTSEIYIESADVTYLRQVDSIPSSGQYYTDGTNYYEPITEFGYQNWPDGICYTNNLTTV